MRRCCSFAGADPINQHDCLRFSRTVTASKTESEWEVWEMNEWPTESISERINAIAIIWFTWLSRVPRSLRWAAHYSLPVYRSWHLVLNVHLLCQSKEFKEHCLHFVAQCCWTLHFFGEQWALQWHCGLSQMQHRIEINEALLVDAAPLSSSLMQIRRIQISVFHSK